MMASSEMFDVIIAGGGPAGSSAAIHLARAGATVLLVEEKKFPRAKLCGEFISPECLTHFQRLGVFDQMRSREGASLTETVFYSGRGRRVSVPSEWFGASSAALGLSRSEMDHVLLQRAREVGVVVMEKMHASGLIQERGCVRGIRVKSDAGLNDYRALLTIDATGRVRGLARHAIEVDDRFGQRVPHRPKTTKRPFVAFKAHLENTGVAVGACEIYFYRGGYGGLSGVEGGVSNLCFIISADEVRRHGSDPETVMREVVMNNSRASYTLENARATTPWLSVALDTFGPGELAPAQGLISIGDAAAFIDPFTGSGMLMAFESGQIAAQTIARDLPSLRQTDQTAGHALARLAQDYQKEYSRVFNSRLRCSAFLRRAAFVPFLAEAAILICGPSVTLRRRLARATRPNGSILSGPTEVVGGSTTK